MRDIKFRAKCKADKTWVYGFYYELPTGEAFIVDNKGTGWGVDKNTVGQFTGLEDKNGKEIYGGDIILYFSSGFIGKVCYHVLPKTEFYLFGEKLNHDLFLTSDIEIIGNQFAHPHLFKEQHQ